MSLFGIYLSHAFQHPFNNFWHIRICVGLSFLASATTALILFILDSLAFFHILFVVIIHYLLL